MNLLGVENLESRNAFPRICVGMRSPTPMQDRVHSLLSRQQRDILWITIALAAFMFAILIFWAVPALASTQDRSANVATLEHSQEQDRRLDNLEKLDARIRDLEQEVSKMQGVGATLVFVTLILQLLLLINQSRVSTKVVAAVQEKERSTTAGGR